MNISGGIEMCSATPVLVSASEDGSDDNWSQRQFSIATILPVLNEVEDIEACIESLLAQTISHQIIVLDGGSSDGTRKILSNYADKITILDNPGRHVGPARNLALEHISEDISHCFEIIGHATIPPDHLEKRVADLIALEKELDVKVGAIGTRVISVENPGLVEGWIEDTLASPLGSGGGQFARFKGRSKAKVPAFALHNVEAVRAVRGWDERFLTSQDSDLSMRMIAAGWPIYRSDVSYVRMRKRSSLRQWWLMCHRYGFWRSKVLLNHPSRFDVRELLPIIGLIACILLGEWAIIPVATYATVLLLSGILATVSSGRLSSVAGLPICLLILHTAFSLGLVDGIFRRGKASRDRTIQSKSSEH